MRTKSLLLTAAAVCVLSAPLAMRAEAGALGGAAQIRDAIADASTVLNVHCVRCWRRGYYAPRYYGWRRPYYGWGGYGLGWRRPYYGWGGYGLGWRRPIYGAVGWPGVGIGIGIGRPWGWGGWGWGGRVGIGIGFGW
jgi:hypothetical protein